jgi:hypothetical protein
LLLWRAVRAGPHGVAVGKAAIVAQPMKGLRKWNRPREAAGRNRCL